MRGRPRPRQARATAFTRIYDEQVWHVYGYFAYRVSTRDDAEDLTQLTFERALRAWDSFDARRATVATWLFAIARNLLVDHYRRDRSRHQEAIGDGVVGEALLGYQEPEERGLGISPDLAAALERLAPRSREVIALRFGGDLTAREIAPLTGLSLTNVQQILSRSLRRLRADLESSQPTDSQQTDGLSADGEAPPRVAQPAASGPTPATPSAATASSTEPEPA
jgi:RNA polymerase sigma-70 factor, ECF subfamily